MAKPALTQGQMHRIGRAFSVLRPDVCLIKRRVSLVDAANAPITDALDTVASAECRVDETASAVLRVAGPAFAGANAAIIALPLGTTVQDQDVIEVERTGARYVVAGSNAGASFALETLAIVARSQ